MGIVCFSGFSTRIFCFLAYIQQQFATSISHSKIYIYCFASTCKFIVKQTKVREERSIQKVWQSSKTQRTSCIKHTNDVYSNFFSSVTYPFVYPCPLFFFSLKTLFHSSVNENARALERDRERKRAVFTYVLRRGEVFGKVDVARSRVSLLCIHVT